MRWPALALLVALTVLHGCSGGSGVDGGPTDATILDVAVMIDADTASCADDVSQWRAIVAGLSRDCVLDTDCSVIGQPSVPCEGYSSIGGCTGEAVNASAYAMNGATAAALEADFLTRGCPCPDGCAVDCSFAHARCAAGTCITEADLPGCNPPPPPLPFEAVMSVLEVDVVGMPELGQGLEVSIDFVANPGPYDFDELPGSPFGCKVIESTPVELAGYFTRNEGVVSITAADGAPAMPPCVFEAGRGYRCLGAGGVGDATVSTGGTLPVGAAQYTITGAAFAAADVGRYLELEGFLANPANGGAFPILAVGSVTEVVVAHSGAVAAAIPETITYVSIAGAGPMPGLADPGLLEDDDLLAVSLDSTGGDGDWPTFTLPSVATGDDFVLDTGSQQLLASLPIDGSAFTIDCAGPGGACNESLGTILEITTSDGAIAGLPPHEMPTPTTKQVSIRCAQVGTGLIVVPAAASAYLESAGATRIRASYRRVNLGQPTGVEHRTDVFVGHATVGFTD